MKLSVRDWGFVLVVAVVLLAVYAGGRKKLGTDVPETAVHQIFFQRLKQGDARSATEKGCSTCHPRTALPQAHPPKEECLVCHRCR